MMQLPRMLLISLRTARQLERFLDRAEGRICTGCSGTFHQADCPAREAYQLRNYLTQRINHPNRHFKY